MRVVAHYVDYVIRSFAIRASRVEPRIELPVASSYYMLSRKHFLLQETYGRLGCPSVCMLYV